MFNLDGWKSYPRTDWVIRNKHADCGWHKKFVLVCDEDNPVVVDLLQYTNPHDGSHMYELRAWIGLVRFSVEADAKTVAEYLEGLSSVVASEAYHAYQYTLSCTRLSHPDECFNEDGNLKEDSDG